ncbi:ammonia-dependent NAD(+) synthetase [Jeotgalibaca sp. MA1X17-3]|uniref:ammonia-dependent NAD(+) synthetase n=1 Tax=Jeotgalibaca sp. MA1X17-3 TaxID=2908211 RepID=UPI001F3C5477|nr:ammonia-dependent NAD(+) synthetase [Jeotgalibaca sp. MA1X17-3]UJF15520.1 ammonia-dependent NAD(+) synthetase [Jeotgalibaca sp. MA1X17-3]
MRPLQKKIIEELKVKDTIDPQQEIRKSIDFMKDYMKAHPFLKTLVLGISGGQDSTLTGKLAQMAITELRQETKKMYQFIAVELPYGKQADKSDVLDALAFIEPDKTLLVNIKPATDELVSALTQTDLSISDFNKGNIKARQRMVVQYAIAGEQAGVVIGTDHAGESVTGFFTKYGDGAADIIPIWRLNKRQGKAMLEVLNCPPHLYNKVPTADLEENRPSLPDEEALGVSYASIDDYLEGKEVSEKDATTIEGWFLRTKHKRHLPINVYDDFWRTENE